MELAVIKIVISIVIVVVLSEVSKRVNPLLGGILSGIPLGAGLSVYFISYSQGVQFVTIGIPWGIAGLASSILFCFFYLLGGKLLEKRNRLTSMAVSSILGFIAFFVSGYIIQKLSLSLISSIAIFTVIFVLNIIYVKKIRIEGNDRRAKGKSASILALLFRGVMVGVIIIAITGAASVAGSEWAGILSAFPSTLYSLLLVLHYEDGDNLYPSVIYGFSYSVSTLTVFYITCMYMLPVLGLNLGFVAVYAVSLLYLYTFSKVKSYAKNIRVLSRE